MSIERVKKYLSAFGKDSDVLEFDESTATVELAAEALGTKPERIAKTIALEGNEVPIVIVTAGDARIDNRKFKDAFERKASFLSADKTITEIGYAIGGVCPFDLPKEISVYLDESLKRFETVFPACGTSNSAIELTLEELENLLPNVRWVNVTKGWE